MVIERMTHRKIFQAITWICVVTIAALSLVQPSLRPVTFVPHHLEHAAIFILAGFAVGLGYPARPVLKFFLLILFAAAVELAQFYVPGRHPRLIDFIVDAMSACAGYALASALLRIWARRRTAPHQS